jgi:hypothetical protein
MVTDDPGAGPLWRLTSPACRVICLAGTDEIKSVAVWSPGHGYWAVRPGRAQTDVIRDFAKQVAGEIVASARPAGTNLPAEGAELLSLAQELTEPRLLLCRIVGVMAQIAAAHVGFPPVVAEAIGRLAGSLASRLTEPEPESPGMRALQYADVTFSVAEDLTLDVGRVEVRLSDDTDRRLWALDRDPPARRGSVADRGRSRVSPVPGQRLDRAARREPGVGWAVRAEPPGVPRAARAELRGVRRPGWYRRVPPYRPGPGDLPGRGELGGRGGPPAR